MRPMSHIMLRVKRTLNEPTEPSAVRPVVLIPTHTQDLHRGRLQLDLNALKKNGRRIRRNWIHLLRLGGWNAQYC